MVNSGTVQTIKKTVSNYLNILKRVLTDTASEDIREKFFSDFSQLTQEVIDAEIFAVEDYDAHQGRVQPVRAETMIGVPRLDNIEQCIRSVVENGIEGDVIETGVWRGGACIFMRAVLNELESDKVVYLADSFEGLPKPDKKYKADKGDQHHTIEFLKVDVDSVKDNFRKYGLLDDRVKFIKGFFSESLKSVPFEKLSILRLDGDMYSSTWDVLTRLYGKLSIGGFCIIDDYHLPACKKAVDDYREQNNITDELIQIDWTGYYWQKT